MGEVLKRCGISVVLTSVCSASSFLAAAIIPVPALRDFSLQAALVVMVCLASMLVVFPAMISLHFKYQRNFIDCLETSILVPTPLPSPLPRRNPVLCSDPPKCATVTRALPPPGGGTVTRVVQPSSPRISTREGWKDHETPPGPSTPSLESLGSSSTRELVDEEGGCRGNERRSWKALMSESEWKKWSIDHWINSIYNPSIVRGKTKAIAVLFFIGTLIAAAWGVMQLKDGLNLTDVVPRNTAEFSFLQAQQVSIK